MKLRLDRLLVEKNYVENLEQAQKEIMAGKVTVNGALKDKAGESVDLDATILMKVNSCPYVSRGGFKLEKGLDVFDLIVPGKIFIDIGCSTGGFTDCLLKNGAQKVYAVDVGYGQLDWKLRNDDRVVCLERKNFRYLTENEISPKADGSVMDVSFISIIKLLPKIKELTKAGSRNIWLIKPQFEASREDVGEKGVIRDQNIHVKVLKKVLSAIEAHDFTVLGLDYSPIQGQKGNIEFLIYTENNKAIKTRDWNQQIKEVVYLAHHKNSQDKVPQ